MALTGQDLVKVDVDECRLWLVYTMSGEMYVWMSDLLKGWLWFQQVPVWVFPLVITEKKLLTEHKVLFSDKVSLLWCMVVFIMQG